MAFRLKNFCLGFRHRIREFYYGVRYLSFSADWGKVDEDLRNAGIAMIDGRMRHGGICDRFKGIISFYNYCRFAQKPFRIKYTFPFELTDYIVPNKYDWRISDNNISNSFWHVRPIYARKESGRRLLKLKTEKQIRFYGNRDFAYTLPFSPFNDDWGGVFNYLFKPSPILQERLDYHKNEINGEYIAAVFRFQNLLGDFKEYHIQALSDTESKEKLISANIEELRKIHEQNPDMRILVTSDSSSFLERASELEFVYAIKGRQSHIDTKNAPQSNAIKPFIDFYMIAGAKKVYGISLDDMYDSEFPVCAAKVGHVPFIRIEKRF